MNRSCIGRNRVYIVYTVITEQNCSPAAPEAPPVKKCERYLGR